MPKGVYRRSRDGVECNIEWSDEQDSTLKALCETKLSYAEMLPKFNTAHPEAPKTRNALLGRAQRKGYSLTKPQKNPRPQRMNETRAANVTRTRRRRSPSTAVVFKDEQDPALMLRDEADKGETRGRSRKLSSNDPRLKERKKGNLPCIIEEQPLTSMPVHECEGGCMWPTSHDITCMEVCGAAVEIGAYCSRHAGAAFRVMPTHSRNRVRHKEDREYERRIDGSQFRERLDPDGAWLNAQMMALDEVTIETEDDGISPLLIPFFMEKLA